MTPPITINKRELVLPTHHEGTCSLALKVCVSSNFFLALKISHYKTLQNFFLGRNMYVIIFIDLDIMLTGGRGVKNKRCCLSSSFLSDVRMNFKDFQKFLFHFLDSRIHLYLLGTWICPWTKKALSLRNNVSTPSEWSRERFPTLSTTLCGYCTAPACWLWAIIYCHYKLWFLKSRDREFPITGVTI